MLLQNLVNDLLTYVNPIRWFKNIWFLDFIIYFNWVQGLSYPIEAGIPIGGPDFYPFIVIEIHYNNQDLLQGNKILIYLYQNPYSVWELNTEPDILNWNFIEETSMYNVYE